MNEQILKDLVATAQKYNYDWNTTFSKFPELKGYDQQVLKDYVTTAEKYNYDYSIVNPKFPELGFGVKKKEEGLPAQNQSVPQAQQQTSQAQPAAQPSATASGLGPSSSASASQGSGLNVGGQADWAPKEDMASFEEKPLQFGTTTQPAQPTGGGPVPVAPKGGEPYLWSTGNRTAAFQEATQKAQAEDLKAAAQIKEQKQYEFNQRKNSVADWNSSVKQITPELMDFDEEYVVPNLNSLFGSYKFTFEESGARDNIKVTAPNGAVKEFQIDTFTEAGDKEAADNFKAFMEANKPTLAKQVSSYQKYEQNVTSDKDQEELLRKFNDDISTYKKDVDAYSKELTQFESDVKEFGTTEDIVRRGELLRQKANDLVQREEQIKNGETVMNESIGRYLQMRSEQGGYWGALGRNLISSATEIGAAQVRFFGNLAVSAIPTKALMGEGSYADAFMKYAKEKKKTPPEISIPENTPPWKAEQMKIEAFNKWKSTLGEDFISDIDDVIKDKEIKKGTVREITELTRETLPSVVMPEVTPEAAERLTSENIVTGAPLMLAKGAAPMIAGAVAGGGAAIGLFALQGYENAHHEMDNNPALADIPESEREIVALPIAVVTGVLMGKNLGHVIGEKVLFDGILTSAIKKAGSNVTGTTFRNIVENEVDSRIARGLLTAAPRAAAGAAFGAASYASDVGIKEAYNLAKENKIFGVEIEGKAFETPESWSQFIGEMGQSAAALAVGDVFMSLPKTLSTAYKAKNFNGVSDKTLSSLDAITANPMAEQLSRRTLISNLESRVAKGEITQEESEKELNNFDRSVRAYKAVPTDLTPSARRQAMGLLSERDALEESIKDKDEKLVKKQKDRINDINKELETLSEIGTEKPAATTTGEEQQKGIPSEISSLSDNELVVINVKSIDEVPEQFRDRAEKKKGINVKVRKLILGLPIGKERTETINEGYTYTLTGKETKDYANQQIKVTEPAATTEPTTEPTAKPAETKTSLIPEELENLDPNDEVTFVTEDRDDVPESRAGTIKRITPRYETKKVLGIPVGEREYTGKILYKYTIPVWQIQELGRRVLPEESKGSGYRLGEAEVSGKMSPNQIIARVDGSAYGFQKMLDEGYSEKKSGKIEDDRFAVSSDNPTKVTTSTDSKGNTVVDIHVSSSDRVSRRGSLQFRLVVPKGVEVDAEALNSLARQKYEEYGIERAVEEGDGRYYEKIGSLVNDFKNSITEKHNAVQESSTEEGVLRRERPTMELPKVGEGDQGQVAAQEGVAAEKAVSEVKPELESLEEVVSRNEKEMSDKVQSLNGSDVSLSDQSKVSIGVTNPKGDTRVLSVDVKDSRGNSVGKVDFDVNRMDGTVSPNSIYMESSAPVGKGLMEAVHKAMTDAGIKIKMPTDKKISSSSPEARQNLEDAIGKEPVVETRAEKTEVIQPEKVTYEQMLAEAKGEKPVAKVDVVPAARDGEFEIMRDGKKAGQIQTETEGDTIRETLVEVYEKGKGTATAAYEKLARMAKEQGKRFVSDYARSDDSENFWSSLEKKGLAKKIGDVNGERFDYQYEYVLPEEKPVEVKTTEEKPAETKPIEPVSEVPAKELPGYQAMMDKVSRIVGEVIKRVGANRDPNKLEEARTRMAEDAMKYLQEDSKVYQEATDTQREQMVRDLNERFGIKMKAAPSAKKVLGIETKKVTVNEMAALKDQIRLEARAAKNVLSGIKAISDKINEFVGKAKITQRQASIVLDRLSKVDPSNIKKVNKFLDYAFKVFSDANYKDKINESKTLRSTIKRISSRDNVLANLRDVANEFSKIDPSMIEDVDAYNRMAKKLIESLRGSVKRGADPKIAEIIKESDVNEYIKKTTEEQNKKAESDLKEEISDILGVDVSDMSAEDLIRFMEGEEVKGKKYDESIARDKINKYFDLNVAVIKEMLKSGKDYFKDEEFSLSEESKKLVGEFIEMDLNKMPLKEALQVIDALSNFINNKSIAKMNTILETYKGNRNAESFEAKKIKVNRISAFFSEGFGRLFYEKIAALPLLEERLFGGDNARMFNRMSGIGDVILGKSRAQKRANNATAEYISKFYNKKANNSDFNNAENNAERGLVAFMTRTVIGSKSEMKAEFNRRKKIIEDSINELSQGTEREQQIGILYDVAYEKLLKDSNTPEEVRSKADKVNLDAIDFWKEKWSELYPELSDVSEGVYNRKLGKDYDYTPDRYAKVEGKETEELKDDDSTFFFNTDGFMYDKRTGVLMEAKRSALREGRYIDLSFDRANSNSYYDALVDINTAAPLRRVKAFFENEAFDRIIKNKDDREILKRRFNMFIRNARGKNVVDYDVLSKLVNKANKLATLATAQALAGPTQIAKQTVSVSANTLMTAGRINLKAGFNRAANDFIDRSGYGISNRGFETQSQIDRINKLVEVAEKSKGDKLFDNIQKLQEKYLELFLQKPDVYIARASWITFYEKALRKQGISTKDIDYNTHKLNREAADYAEDMVNRQQNISDRDLQGTLLSSKEPVTKLVVKTVMPFATFRLNQTVRMYNDLAVLTSNSATKQERIAAIRSLGGFAAEMATFKAISLGLGYGMGSIANAIMEHKETEDEKKKRVKGLVQGQLTSFVTDVLSPLPITDAPIVMSSNALLESLQSDVKKEDIITLYGAGKSDWKNNLGVFGVTAERASQLFDLAEMVKTGSYTDDYGNKKILSDKDADNISKILMLSVLSDIGLIPAGPEIASIARKAIKGAQRRGMTEKQYEEAEKLGVYKSREEMKRYDPDLYELTFGKYSPDYESEQAKKELEKEDKEREQQLRDMEFNYTPPSKKSSGKSFGSGFGSGGFGSGFGGGGFGSGYGK